MKRRLPLAIAGTIALSSSLLFSCSQPATQAEGESSSADSEVVADSTTGDIEADAATDDAAMADGESGGDFLARTTAEIADLDQQVEALASQDPPPQGMGRLLKKQEAARNALANLEAVGEPPSAEAKKDAKRAIAQYKRNLERVQARSF
ncbi:MAG: hypothetical protein ACFB8W_16920 [Elainellaceae cyanobacterium]